MTDTSLGTVLRHVRKLVAAHGAEHATDSELLHAFAARRDQAAFAVLVGRHGPMVLKVCQRVLQHQQDAEDAFQATFLILARKATAVRSTRALAGWLYGAAYRMALSIRRARVRRQHYEAKASAMSPMSPSTDLAWREVQALLEEEVQRLPEKYRMTFVLCCLENKSRAEAARLLGVKEGTISSRLDQARKLLRHRLARRGVTLSGVLTAAALTEPAKALGLPPALAAATARAAVALAADKAATGVVSAHVAALVEQGARALFTSKLNLAPLLSAALLAGVGLIACQSPADRPGAAAPVAEPPPPAASQPQRVDVNGEPLPAEALARLGTLRFRPGDFCSSLVFAPDGKTLVSAATSGTICFFDLATGQVRRRFQAGTGTQRPAALSSDGRWLLVKPGRKNGLIDKEATLELWDCTTGRKVRAIGKAPYISGLFSQDGRTVAALRYDSVVELWDRSTGQLIRHWKASDEPGYDLFFTARFTTNDKQLLTGHHGKRVCCWDVATGARQHEFRDVLTNTLFAISPQGVLAVDGTDYTAKKNTVGELAETRIRLFDVVTGKELRPLIARQKRNALGKPWWLMSGEFSPDGRLLAIGGWGGLISLWDMAAAKERRSWPYIPSMPGATRFSPDGRQLAVCDAGTTIQLFDVATGAARPTPPGSRSGYFDVMFTPDGQTVLTLGRANATLRAWDPATGRLRHRQEWPAHQMGYCALTRDGTTLFSRANDQMVRTWDVATGKEIRHWPDHFGSPYFWALIPSPDGKTLALLHQQSPMVVLVDAITGKERRRLEGHSPSTNGAAFLPDGQALVTWGGDARARIWDLSTGREIRQIAYTEPPPTIRPPLGVPGTGVVNYVTAVSPDGRLLAFGSPGRFIMIHDLASGRVVRRVDQLPTGVSNLVFSPDSHTLAWSGPEDSAVRLLEVVSGRERHQYVGHLGRVTALAFAPDGRRLLSGSVDTTALVWDLAALPAGTPEDRATAWADLAGTDAGRAYRAVRRLAATPAFFNGRLQPIPAADAARVARLIADLDRDDFTIRQKASTDLERLGDTAAAAYRKALKEQPSAEKRRRLEALLDKQFQAAWAMTPERLRAARSLEALELSGTRAARQVLEKLAGGAAGAWLTEEAKAELHRLDMRAQGR